ncbi:hypothetical protein HCC61_06380 [Streptomyces sp. HNM0575]|uniref:hypothetical protein n=1 Tax=Streptomyces sp. HNM0575 TaxID=2716338 RepID=UPI00145F021B|nr:hypothetical protein [Streptomyces sp. HNM0575]NLU72310.1 hypothetical protein [Streptomyces sp. HNM0575]
MPPTPSWARDSGPADSGAPLPAQRSGEDLAEDRLAHFLDTLVSEQTATLHALGAARTGTVSGDAGAELPGEAAAMAAFRAAHPRAGAEHSGTVDISAGPTEASTVVGRRAAARENRRRSRGRPGGARRSSLVGRPLRAGFAMAVAGCALGGAAVAAGTGVLPTPFGGGDSPAASVSPLASPGTSRDEAAGGGGGSPYDGGPRRGTREGGSPSDSPTGEDLAGTERGREGKPPGGPKDWWHGGGKHLSEADKKAMARALCSAYENGGLSLRDRVLLETAAGGSANVKKFCDKHDGGRENENGSDGANGAGGVGTPGVPGSTGGSQGSSSGNAGGDEGGDGGNDGGDQGGNESGGDSEGSGGSRPDSGGQSTDGGTGESGTASAAPSDDPSASADADASSSPSADATAGS